MVHNSSGAQQRHCIVGCREGGSKGGDVWCSFHWEFKKEVQYVEQGSGLVRPSCRKWGRVWCYACSMEYSKEPEAAECQPQQQQQQQAVCLSLFRLETCHSKSAPQAVSTFHDMP